MKTSGTTLKKFLFAFILLVMLTPLAQQHLKIYESEPLKGFQTPAEQAWFSFGGWWSGAYQETYNGWYNENFGFRPELVRFYNQVGYSLFEKVKANGVIVGKDDYLYELNYINAYTGKDYIGYAALNDMTSRIRQLQDSLEKRNITLLVCLAPGKASFYPEYIPDEYGPASDSTNYKVFAKLLAQDGVNHIDYNKWFMNMKGKTDYLLYPKTGVHWSRYGSLMAIDSLIKYVEHKRSIDLPGVIWERTILSDTLQSPDDDIAKGMNLMCEIKGLPMGYPVYHFEDTTGKSKAKMMTISDSFFWSMFDIRLAPNSLSEVSFYYYNKEVHHTDGRPMTPAVTVTTMQDAERHDVIVLMATECTVWGIGWGFINDAYDHFVMKKQLSEEDIIIQKYESLIRMDEKWMKDIRLKADANGISLDSMIYLDAKYMAGEELRNK
jgi:hypothetical protein